MDIGEDVWVIIPASNEAKRINGVIKGVKRYCKNVVVVDDGSADETSKVAKESGVKVLRHIVNLGKGAGLKTGCDFAIKNGAEKLIVIDADGQHDPDEIPNFLEALKYSDMVFSYRVMKRDMPFLMKFGNWVINKTAKMLFGIKVKDSQCGYRAFTANTYRKIRWKATGYYVESEMVVNTGKKHLVYKELPIKTIYSDRYKGTTVMDGIKIVFNMFLWRLKG